MSEDITWFTVDSDQHGTSEANNSFSGDFNPDLPLLTAAVFQNLREGVHAHPPFMLRDLVQASLHVLWFDQVTLGDIYAIDDTSTVHFLQLLVPSQLR